MDVTPYIPQAKSIARRSAKRYGWKYYDEFVSTALLALVQVAERYDPEVGPFENFAASRIKGAIVDYIRKEATARRHSSERAYRGGSRPEEDDVILSLDHPARDKHNNPTDTTFLDVTEDPFPTPEELAIREEDHRELWAWLKKLPEPHKSIIHACIIDEMTQVEVGELMGRHHSRVSQLQTEALFLLRWSYDMGAMPDVPERSNRSKWVYDPRKINR
jgi:RNA polymerase sigma factor (sigma-70 family)